MKYPNYMSKSLVLVGETRTRWSLVFRRVSRLLLTRHNTRATSFRARQVIED